MISPFFISNDIALFFSGDPFDVELVKNNAYTVETGYASLLICFEASSAPADGQVLAFNVNGSVHDFDIKDTPVSKNDLPSVSGSFEDGLKLIVEHLLLHPYFAKYFNIEFVNYNALSGFGYIKLTAVNRGSLYNIEINSGTNTVYVVPTNTVAVGFTDEIDLLHAESKAIVSLKIKSDIIFDSTDNIVTDIELHPVEMPDDLSVKYNLHDIASYIAAYHQKTEPVYSAQPQPYRDVVLVTFKVEDSFTGSELKLINNPLIDEENGNQLMIFFKGSLNSVNLKYSLIYRLVNLENNLFKMLTNRPYTSIINKDYPVFLPVLFDGTIENQIQITILYSNGTEVNIYSAISNIDYLSIYQVCIDRILYNFDMHNPGGLTEIGFRVTAIGSLNYETYTFIYDQRSHIDELNLVFENSLGRYDNMRCVGVTDFSIKRISETSEHVKSVYSRADKGTIEMVYNEVQQEYTCRTGWLQSAEEKMWIQDLLVSKYIARFLSIPEQFKRMNLQAMILVADSVKMYSNDDAMWQFEFKLQVANASNAFDKVLNVTEPFTDSYIEFILDVSSITTDAIISMSHSVDYWVWLNGKEKYDSPPSIQISTTGTFVFKVNWKSQMDVNTQFYFAAFDMEASIQITKIVGFDVAALQFIGFKNINDSYLVERIKTLFALNTLVINCTSPSGMSIDDLLIACAQALPNNQLATVDLSTSAPGAVGSDMKDYLIDQGVAVYTA